MYIDRVKDRDKEYIFGWLKEIWSGHDYIPLVWDNWMNEGEFLAVYDEGKPIAIWHIKWLGDIAWLEGMRVKPDYQGRGIAKLANKYSIKLARDKGIKKALLITMIDNKPARKSLESIGFTNVAAYTRVIIDNIKGDEKVNYKTGLDWNTLNSISPNLKSNNFIMASEKSPWIFLPITNNNFYKIDEKKRIYIEKALSIIDNTIRIGEKEYLYIRYLDADNKAELLKMIKILSNISRENEMEKLFIYIPYNSKTLEYAKDIIKIDPKETFLVYEYVINQDD